MQEIPFLVVLATLIGFAFVAQMGLLVWAFAARKRVEREIRTLPIVLSEEDVRVRLKSSSWFGVHWTWYRADLFLTESELIALPHLRVLGIPAVRFPLGAQRYARSGDSLVSPAFPLGTGIAFDPPGIEDGSVVFRARGSFGTRFALRFRVRDPRRWIDAWSSGEAPSVRT